MQEKHAIKSKNNHIMKLVPQKAGTEEERYGRKFAKGTEG